jgi:type I site-specific restriction-modification system R (restriction) subunit
VQVIKQFEQAGSAANRYDVTILVNGLPLVQIELKKRGVAIREAFNQVHRYPTKYRLHQIPNSAIAHSTRYFSGKMSS